MYLIFLVIFNYFDLLGFYAHHEIIQSTVLQIHDTRYTIHDIIINFVIYFYTWTDYKTNTQIAKELKVTHIFDRLPEYKRNWIQHVNRMPRNRLPRVMKHYSPTGRRNHGRPLKRLLDT